jgi:hypothetical protein
VRTARWLLGLAALGFAGYFVIGSTRDSNFHPSQVLAFMVTAIVAHDLVLLPLAIGSGALVVRFVPVWARTSAQAALFASVVVTAVSLPLLIGGGRTPDNPSRQPLDYPRGLLLTLGAIWLIAGGFATYSRLRRTTAPADDRRAHGP